MVFPKKENDVISLAQTMLAGLAAHAADFPSIDAAALQTAYNDYQANRDNQENARSQAQIATATKAEALEELVKTMRTDLKQAEVDTIANPTKLTEIGWSPKAAPSPISPPAMPTELESVYQGPGSLLLNWNRPACEPNRPVANYLVQRRDQNSSSGEFGEWTLADSTLKTESNLIGQPRGLQLEYRIIATNSAGDSVPSNTVAVVL